MTTSLLLAIALPTFVLTACGGGGGGGSGGGPALSTVDPGTGGGDGGGGNGTGGSGGTQTVETGQSGEQSNGGTVISEGEQGTGETFSAAEAGPLEERGRGAAGDLDYAAYGGWAASGAGLFPFGGGSFAAAGMPTTAMPSGGSATYRGGAVGEARVGGTDYSFTGTTNLTADFAQGSIAGGIVGIRTQAGGVDTGPMNDIALAGGINGSGFSGSALPAAATAQTAVDIGATGGTFEGTFFGPEAKELAGAFTMAGGGDTVTGSFGGSQ